MSDISVGTNPYINYTPVDESAAKASKEGDLGTITGITYDDGKMVVTTDKGTLTFTGPALEKYKGEFSVGDILNAKDATGECLRTSNVTAAAIMILLIELNLTGQESAREAKMATKQLEWSTMDEAVEKYKTAAWMAFGAGMCTAAGQAFSGFMTLGSAKAGAKSMKNAPSGQDPTITGLNARHASAGWDAASAFGQATGQVGSSTFQLIGGLEQAEGKRLEAESQQFASLASMAEDFQKSLKDTADKVNDALSKMYDADFQTKQKLLA